MTTSKLNFQKQLYNMRKIFFYDIIFEPETLNKIKNKSKNKKFIKY